MTDDLVADENILFSMESGDSLDVFPYISPRTQTNTFNFNIKSDFSPLISSISSYSRTFFDYGMKISEYYRVLNDYQGMFDMDSDYDFDTAKSNVERFAADTTYSEILYNKQILNSIDLELILKSYLVFDQLKYGIHFSNAKGYIDFNQYGFSISAMRSILDRFYINFNYDLQSKTVSGGNDYNNSYFIMRFGYQF